MSVRTPVPNLPSAMDEITDDLDFDQEHPMQWVTHFLRRIDESLARIADTIEYENSAD